MTDKLKQLVIDAFSSSSGNKGLSLGDIENFMKNRICGVPSSRDIKSVLQKALDNGTLSIVDGKYKLREQARRRSRSKKRSGSKRRSRSRKRSRAKSGGKRSRSRRRRRSRKHKGHKAGDDCGA